MNDDMKIVLKWNSGLHKATMHPTIECTKLYYIGNSFLYSQLLITETILLQDFCFVTLFLGRCEQIYTTNIAYDRPKEYCHQSQTSEPMTLQGNICRRMSESSE